MIIIITESALRLIRTYSERQPPSLLICITASNTVKYLFSVCHSGCSLHAGAMVLVSELHVTSLKTFSFILYLSPLPQPRSLHRALCVFSTSALCLRYFSVPPVEGRNWLKTSHPRLFLCVFYYFFVSDLTSENQEALQEEFVAVRKSVKSNFSVSINK